VVATARGLWLGAVLLWGVTAWAAQVTLESGSTLTIIDAPYSRALPHAFHDQARASLARLFPQHVLLASRRFVTLGDVAYALVCFRETPSSERVVIQAAAVRGIRAWNLETSAPATTYGDTLVQVLEQIGKLR
jgi:hypothetical protein